MAAALGQCLHDPPHSSTVTAVWAADGGNDRYALVAGGERDRERGGWGDSPPESRMGETERRDGEARPNDFSPSPHLPISPSLCPSVPPSPLLARGGRVDRNATDAARAWIFLDYVGERRDGAGLLVMGLVGILSANARAFRAASVVAERHADTKQVV